MPGWTYRENRVPHYQRLFLHPNGVRQWYKTPRSKMLIYPYLVVVWGLLGTTLYATGRVVLGHKSFFGKD